MFDDRVRVSQLGYVAEECFELTRIFVAIGRRNGSACDYLDLLLVVHVQLLIVVVIVASQRFA
jgi:hypothetical protein